MSQRRFSVPPHIEVLTGWDRPLHRFFLVIWDSRIPAEDHHILYSNLEDPEAPMGDLMLLDVLDRLVAFRIPYPPTLIEDLSDDQELDRGNHEVTYPRYDFVGSAGG